MDLHRTGKQADWETVPPIERNWWQRLATSTRGVVTPANVVSVVGGSLVVLGLVYIYQGKLFSGLACLFIGRLADVADGYIAAKTRTKSPLGEAADAIIDKLTLLAAIVVFLATNVVPWIAVLVIALFNAANAALSIVARLRKHRLHPSLIGKITAVFQWTAIISFVASAAFRGIDADFIVAIFGVLAVFSLLVSVFLGFITLAGYGIAGLRPRESRL